MGTYTALALLEVELEGEPSCNDTARLQEKLVQMGITEIASVVFLRPGEGVKVVPAVAEGEEVLITETWELLNDDQLRRAVHVLSATFGTTFEDAQLSVSRATRTIAGKVMAYRNLQLLSHTISKAELQQILGE